MQSTLQAPAENYAKENWADLIQVAVEEVFQMMVGGQATFLPNSELEKKDFSAMVGLAGAMCGVFTVSAPADAARAIAASMLGADSVDNTSIMDAMGEVTNMVAGNFKSKIIALAEGCMLSVPTVVAGGDYEMHSLADGFRTQLCFEFSGQKFCVALQLSA
jgi:chemotaxis protein CheX